MANTGQFPATVVTKAGKVMIAQSQGNSKLTFTRVALGDGLLEATEDITNLTALKHECLSVTIEKCINLQNGQYRIRYKTSNKTIDVGFWHREIGVMAKIDDGAEQLYAYTNAGNAGSFIYDKTTPIDIRILDLDFVVGNADANKIVVITDDKKANPTTEDVKNSFAEHNADKTAHTEAIKEHDNNADAHSVAMDKHNADDSAHENRFKQYVKKAGDTITGFLHLGKSEDGTTDATPPDDDYSDKVPTTGWVQRYVAKAVFAVIAKLAGTSETGVSSSGSFLGINWLLAQNGYICFGKFFGGFTLQWGFTDGQTGHLYFPITFNTACFYLKTSVSNPAGSANADYDYQIISLLKDRANIFTQGYNDTNTDYFHGIYYFCVGR